MSTDRHESIDLPLTSLDDDDIEKSRDTSDTAERKGLPPPPFDDNAGLTFESQYLIAQPLDIETGIGSNRGLISFNQLESEIKKLERIKRNIQWANRFNSTEVGFCKLLVLSIIPILLPVLLKIFFPEIALTMTSYIPLGTYPVLMGVIMLVKGPLPRQLISDYFASAADEAFLEIGVRDAGISERVRWTRLSFVERVTVERSLQESVDELQRQLNKLQELKEIKLLLENTLLTRPLAGSSEVSAIANLILDHYMYGQADFIRPATGQATSIRDDATSHSGLSTSSLIETVNHIDINESQAPTEEAGIDISSSPSSFTSRRTSFSTSSDTRQTVSSGSVPPNSIVENNHVLSASGMSTLFHRKAAIQPPATISTTLVQPEVVSENNNTGEIVISHLKFN